MEYLNVNEINYWNKEICKNQKYVNKTQIWVFKNAENEIPICIEVYSIGEKFRNIFNFLMQTPGHGFTLLSTN